MLESREMKTGLAESRDPNLPLPPRQFKGFMLFWHVFLLGGLVVTLFISWTRSPSGFDGRLTALTCLAAVQAAIYLKVFAYTPELSLGWWGVYFGVSLGILVAEVKLDPYFLWVVGAYVGQMLGALPPRYSVPGALLVIGGFLAWRLGWTNLIHLNGWAILAGAASVGSWVVLVLFLRKLSDASSDRARVILKLEAAQRELEVAKDREAELAVLRERERLARDLHDSLGHALVTLSVQLEALQRLYPVDPARGTELVQEMKKLVRASMDDLRRALGNLRTPGLGDRRLTDALRTCAAAVQQRSGLVISTQVDGENQLPLPVAEALWRAGQEALANTERHARAQHVSLELRRLPGAVLLRVLDDGIGLPDGCENKSGHYGLRGLRERIEGLGGTLVLGKAEPKGTLLEARIPVVA